VEIIRTYNICKTFGETIAVDDVSLHVGVGEIYGFVGLNGAGKTTTIRMLLGMIRPTSGTAYLFGRKVGSGINVWKDVGYLVESPYSYPNLSVIENLEIYRRLRNIAGKECIDRVMDLLKLNKFKKTKSKHLSTGNQQRLGLAKALMHEPKLLILDEPVNGLDPSGIVEIRELIEKLSSEGTTIFLSSHILSEISILANKIGIIHEGKLIRELLNTELEEQLQKKLIIDTIDNNAAIPLLTESGFNVRINNKGMIETNHPSAVHSPETISELLVKHQLPPKEIYLFEENLEDYFLSIISKEEYQL
jgi:ABC-2 type transport system ATP-binding protein